MAKVSKRSQVFEISDDVCKAVCKAVYGARYQNMSDAVCDAVCYAVSKAGLSRKKRKSMESRG